MADVLAIDPQQEIFTQIKLALEALGYSVYDGFLPPEGTPYPFVYLGDCQQNDESTKNAVIGRVSLTIHVWHNSPLQRGTVSSMLANIKAACRRTDHTKNFAWSARSVASQIIPDNTTKSPLLHGVVDVEWAFS